MKDKDFRVGDKITGFKIYHGIVSNKFQRGIFSVDDIKNTKSFHGHLDLEDIQRYIESKEQKPVRNVTKYLNIFLDDFGEKRFSLWDSQDLAKNAESKDAKYLCIAHPIEVTE